MLMNPTVVTVPKLSTTPDGLKPIEVESVPWLMNVVPPEELKSPCTTISPLFVNVELFCRVNDVSNKMLPSV